MTAAGPSFLTFGCRLNSYETEVMRGHAAAAGLADAVIVNTCAVTAEAERQARQAIRRARRERPGARIIVTGCAVQTDPARFAAMPEVDLVLGNVEKLKPESFLPPGASPGTGHPAPRIQVTDIATATETAGHLVGGFDGRARAFVQVQNGCDHRCTFCIIPFGRGPSRSVPMGAIATEMRTLVAAGYREIVLTGVDITSYGADLPGQPGLGQMLRRVLAQVPELPRLRLSSLDPVGIDADLWALIADEPRLMPHLHLSLQAGDDLVLKRMKRRHLRADVLALCRRARDLRPDIVFGADLIAGFPTETGAMFANTLDLVAACDLTWLHVFPYSPRPGTAAARMPMVEPALRRERAARLRAAGAAAVARLLAARAGRRETLLMESDRIGRTAQFAEAVLDRPAAPGTLVDAVVLGHDGDRLTARSLEEAA